MDSQGGTASLWGGKGGKEGRMKEEGAGGGGGGHNTSQLAHMCAVHICIILWCISPNRMYAVS